METGQVTELAPTESRARGATIDELYVHGPMLLAAARMITLDNDEAEDLVQTTFEIAIRHIGSLREPRALRAWLLRIQTRRRSGSSAGCGDSSASTATSASSNRQARTLPSARTCGGRSSPSRVGPVPPSPSTISPASPLRRRRTS